MPSTNRVELVAFDLDGTLVEEPSSWSKIHHHFGTEDTEKKNLDDYVNGRITYDQFAVKDIEAWPDGMHIEDVWRILKDYRYVPGARSCLQELQTRGIRTAIVSGGLDLIAHSVADDLSIDYVLANSLEVNQEGILTGRGINRVEPLKKDHVFAHLLRRIGLGPSQVAAVGNSVYDAALLKMAAIGIVLGDDDGLGRTAHHRIDTLHELPSKLK